MSDSGPDGNKSHRVAETRDDCLKKGFSGFSCPPPANPEALVKKPWQVDDAKKCQESEDPSANHNGDSEIASAEMRSSFLGQHEGCAF